MLTPTRSRRWRGLGVGASRRRLAAAIAVADSRSRRPVQRRNELRARRRLCDEGRRGAAGSDRRGLRGLRRQRPAEDRQLRAHRRADRRLAGRAGRAGIGRRAANALAADPRRRVFVVYLDIEHVDSTGSYNIKEPLIELLTRMMGPDDLVGVMTPHDEPCGDHVRPPDASDRGRPAPQLDLGPPRVRLMLDERGAALRLLSCRPTPGDQPVRRLANGAWR